MGKVDLDVPHGADTSVRKDRKKPTNGSSTVINEMEKPQQGDVTETDWGLIHSGWAGVACWRRLPLS